MHISSELRRNDFVSRFPKIDFCKFDLIPFHLFMKTFLSPNRSPQWGKEACKGGIREPHNKFKLSSTVQMGISWRIQNVTLWTVAFLFGRSINFSTFEGFKYGHFAQQTPTAKAPHIRQSTNQGGGGCRLFRAFGPLFLLKMWFLSPQEILGCHETIPVQVRTYSKISLKTFIFHL